MTYVKVYVRTVVSNWINFKFSILREINDKICIRLFENKTKKIL